MSNIHEARRHGRWQIWAAAMLTAFVLAEPSRTAEIQTWIPAHRIPACREALQNTCSNRPFAPYRVVSRIGLQWWRLARDGRSIERLPGWTEADLRQLRECVRPQATRLLLCICNCYEGDWDWRPVRRALERPAALAQALSEEVERLGLDGVDCDLEGPANVPAGSYTPDRTAFVEFVAQLSIPLRARGRQLTVCTFASRWGAPRADWWGDLRQVIDGLHIMSYQSYAEAPGGLSYSNLVAQARAAGYSAHQIVLGMHASRSEWGRSSSGQAIPAAVHVRHVSDRLPGVGIAVWDAALQSEAWRSSELWQAVLVVRSTGASR